MDEPITSPEAEQTRPLKFDEVEMILSRLRESVAAQQESKSGVTIGDPFNFSRAGNLSADQMRAVGTINDTVARSLTHTVGAWLRTEFQVSLNMFKQMPYFEFVRRFKLEDSRDRSHLSVLRMEPGGAVGVLELGLELAPPIVDLLLGGTGKAEPPRMLTDIEELIMASVLEIMVKELNAGWLPVGLQFALEQRESSSQVARLMPVGEKTLCVIFDIQMPEATGTLALCLPSVVLNTILRKLGADRDRPRRRSDEVRTRVRELVGEATVGSVLQFPPVRLSAREIAQLTPGHILRLPVPRHAAAELRVSGLALGRARAVKVGEHRGACMEAAGGMEAGGRTL